MKELELKYGCNPNQKPSKIYMEDGSELPIKVLSGKPGYINFLDAFNGWQLVRDLKKATGLPAATSFKHVCFHWSSAYRDACKNLLGRGYGLAEFFTACMCICPCKRRRQNVFLR